MIKNLRKTRVLVGLGANMPSSSGTPKQTLAAALERLEDEGVSELESSQFYRTPCFPIGAGPDYVNACASFLSDEPPQRLLALLHAIEAEFGRQRDQRWGQRSLDLDLLAYGDDVHPDLSIYTAWKDLPMEAQRERAPHELILPHPRLQDRAFVLIPLCDIAADWCHPVLRKTVREMARTLQASDVKDVVPI